MRFGKLKIRHVFSIFSARIAPNRTLYIPKESFEPALSIGTKILHIDRKHKKLQGIICFRGTKEKGPTKRNILGLRVHTIVSFTFIPYQSVKLITRLHFSTLYRRFFLFLRSYYVITISSALP